VILIGGNVEQSYSRNKGLGRIKSPPGHQTEFKTVLSVSANDDDCASLEHILEPRLAVVGTATIVSILSLLREIPIPTVIFDCDVMSFKGEELFDRISLLPDLPLVIVTSRLEDERLWAEALNLGAWDVLAEPFVADEVIRNVSIAGQHWQDRHDVYNNRTTQRKSAKGTRYLAATGT
jgi:DNA-binding NtrC family response regulator